MGFDVLYCGLGGAGCGCGNEVGLNVLWQCGEPGGGIAICEVGLDDGGDGGGIGLSEVEEGGRESCEEDRVDGCAGKESVILTSLWRAIGLRNERFWRGQERRNMTVRIKCARGCRRGFVLPGHNCRIDSPNHPRARQRR